MLSAEECQCTNVNFVMGVSGMSAEQWRAFPASAV